MARIASENPGKVPYVVDGDVLTFPGNIHIVIGSKELHALSLNIVAAILDEGEFRKKKGKKNKSEDEVDDAMSLYNAITERITSRFIGKFGFLSILISSKRFKDSPVETHIQKVRHDVTTKIYSYAIWEVKDKKIYSGKTFKLFTGTKTVKPKILDGTEDLDHYRSQIGSKILDVPIEYKLEASRDIYNFLRNTAGIATLNINPFFPEIEEIRKGLNYDIENVTEKVYGDPDKNHLISSLKRFFEKSVSGRWILHRAVREWRYLHIDLSETGNNTGIAMCHKEMNQDGNIMYVWDFAFAVVPGSHGINLDAVEGMIAFLKQEMNIKFGSITFDQYQSAHAIQFCRDTLKYDKKIAKKFSVDSNPESYYLFKSHVFDNLVRIGFRDDIELEFLDLEENEGHIDTKSTNDISDGIAGSFYSAYIDVATRPSTIFEQESKTSSTEFENLKKSIYTDSDHDQIDPFEQDKNKK